MNYVFFVGSEPSDQNQSSESKVAEETDITSPVRSFLEKSKMQVEQYLRQQLSILDEEEDEDEALEEHLEIIQESQKEPLLEDLEELTSKLSGTFSRLEDFLNPDNSAIKKLIEHRVLKNPTVLSELLDVNFSDLLTVFSHLISTKATSVEAAYLHVLQIVEDEGSSGISRLANSKHVIETTDSESDELVHAYASGIIKDQNGGSIGERVEYRVKNSRKSSPVAKNPEEPSFSSQKDTSDNLDVKDEL